MKKKWPLHQGGGPHHRHRLNRCHFHGNARILLRHLCFGRCGRTGTSAAGKIHCEGELLLVYRTPPPAPENSVRAKNGPDRARWIILRSIDRSWGNATHSPNLGKESELGSDARNVESSRQSGPHSGRLLVALSPGSRALGPDMRCALPLFAHAVDMRCSAKYLGVSVPYRGATPAP